jgi:hypothetical protein
VRGLSVVVAFVPLALRPGVAFSIAFVMDIDNTRPAWYFGSDTQVNIAASVKSLEPWCFGSSPSLARVTFGQQSTLCLIQSRAFASCRNLKSIIILIGVTVIGDECFLPSLSLCSGDCSMLESITIPSSVETMGVDCFTDCSQHSLTLYSFMRRKSGYRCEVSKGVLVAGT